VVIAPLTDGLPYGGTNHAADAGELAFLVGLSAATGSTPPGAEDASATAQRRPDGPARRLRGAVAAHYHDEAVRAGDGSVV
jgi:hypothetical protein